MYYNVTVVFTDNAELNIKDVAEVKVTESDYIVRGDGGNTAIFPKVNVYSFSYRKAD